MDYQSKYLKYKNKYLELKKIMNQNQIGGSNFLGLGDNEDEKTLSAPRQTYKQQQLFFPPGPLNVTQLRDVPVERPKGDEQKQVFFPNPKKQTPPFIISIFHTTLSPYFTI